VALPLPGPAGGLAPGVIVRDSWWVNGRNRSVMAVTSVDADPAQGKLPSPPAAVAAVLAACGKVDETKQIPLAESPAGSAIAAAPRPVAQAVSAILLDYRNRLTEVVDRAALPHDLPPAREALGTIRAGEAIGPKKPVLVRAFQPMGYDCRGGSGVFTLRRRTAGNLTVEISLDVGTWSRSLTTTFSVIGFGFKVHLMLPVSKRDLGARQYQIGDAQHWQQLVDNVAALVAELDRTFVPEIEAAAGPAPAWYQPDG
jgi:hypothetical protein